MQLEFKENKKNTKRKKRTYTLQVKEINKFCFFNNFTL